MLMDQFASARSKSLRIAGLSSLAMCAVVSLTTPLQTPVFAGNTIADDNNILIPHAGMLRFPDVSSDSIVFLYANDLWTVSRQGGIATPLAAPDGIESFPKFSKDGKTIAFVGNYDGNSNIYTIPSKGGIATQVTTHPAFERLCDWTDSNQLLYASNAQSSINRTQQLMVIDAEGGFPDTLPIPYGAVGDISADGKWIAYTPYSRSRRTWKRYMGGLATDIWLFNLKTKKSKKITDWQGTDAEPMWHGNTVYYLSDAGSEHRLNIWAYNTKSNKRSQITKFKDFDLKYPSMGPGSNGKGEIIFQHGADLVLLNLGTKKHKSVEIKIPGDRPTLRTKTVDVSNLIQSWDISPTGKRAAVQARGDVWTLPAENGVPRNLTKTDGTAERSPSWSPDGKWVAYFSDATGEYELYTTQSDGKGDTIQRTYDSQTFYWDIIWSPNSEMILFADKSGKILLHTLETGETITVDIEPTAFRSTGRNFSWSHENQFITYARVPDDANTPAIWIYNVESAESKQVTSGMFPDVNPVFDRKGEYLYFGSARSFSPTYSDLDTSFVYENTGNLLAVPLQIDTDILWELESDEEEWEDPADDDDETSEEDADAEEDSDTDASDDDNNSEDQSDQDSDDSDTPAATLDAVSGTWSGTVVLPDAGELPVSMSLTLNADDNSVTGTLDAGPYSGELTGQWDPDTKDLTLNMNAPDGTIVEFNLHIEDNSMTGTASAEGIDVEINAERDVPDIEESNDDTTDDKEDEDEDEEIEPIVIDFDGFEQRAIILPVGNGRYCNQAQCRSR